MTATPGNVARTIQTIVTLSRDTATAYTCAWTAGLDPMARPGSDDPRSGNRPVPGEDGFDRMAGAAERVDHAQTVARARLLDAHTALGHALADLDVRVVPHETIRHRPEHVADLCLTIARDASRFAPAYEPNWKAARPDDTQDAVLAGWVCDTAYAHLVTARDRVRAAARAVDGWMPRRPSRVTGTCDWCRGDIRDSRPDRLTCSDACRVARSRAEQEAA